MGFSSILFGYIAYKVVANLDFLYFFIDKILLINRLHKTIYEYTKNYRFQGVLARMVLKQSTGSCHSDSSPRTHFRSALTYTVAGLFVSRREARGNIFLEECNYV